MARTRSLTEVTHGLTVKVARISLFARGRPMTFNPENRSLTTDQLPPFMVVITPWCLRAACAPLRFYKLDQLVRICMIAVILNILEIDEDLLQVSNLQRLLSNLQYLVKVYI